MVTMTPCGYMAPRSKGRCILQRDIAFLHELPRAFPPTLTLYHIYIERHATRCTGLPLLQGARRLTGCLHDVDTSAALWNTDTTPWEAMTMPLALHLNVQVKDGTLVLTDCVGKTVTFSEAQSVRKQVSMITLGARCGLPKRARATGFGFQSRPSSSDSRNAVLQGTAADL